MRYYYFVDDVGALRIKASRKPSLKNRPTSGAWVVREATPTGWRMPCFPEITWGKLKMLRYIGSEPIKEAK